MKATYDIIVGLGSMCSCSQALREAGLQLTSFPFDWNGGPGIRGKTDLITGAFVGFLDRTRMVRLAEPKFSDNQYWIDDLNFKYYHDFPIKCDFETEYPKVQAKYRRRITKLYELIERSRKILLVYIICPGWPDCTIEDVDYCKQKLAEKWPGKQFDFLIFRHSPGVTYDSRLEEVVEGCRTIAFDYQDRKEDDWRVDYHLLGKWLATQYEVMDYRTPAERKAWESHERNERYARFKAKNFVQLWYNKLQFKLYKHFRTRLERKGII